MHSMLPIQGACLWGNQYDARERSRTMKSVGVPEERKAYRYVAKGLIWRAGD
jgi:hypothetical protein